MSEGVAGVEKGWWGMFIGAIMTIWAGLPDKHKAKAIDAVVEGFSKILGHFFDAGLEKAGIGVEKEANSEASA